LNTPLTDAAAAGTRSPAETAAAPAVALGLMSGTSLDGIDAAIITTDGKTIVARGPALTIPYPPAFRDGLRGLLGRRPLPSDAALIRELDERHIAAVHALTAAAAAPAVDVIGYHGQTVWHRPAAKGGGGAPSAGETIQVGCGQRLADALEIPVVAQFRVADVAAGGEGAPLVPLYHRALALALPRPLAVLNVGGVANVTWIGGDEAPPASDGGAAVIAFDTGPGNALIDDWLQRTLGLPYDDGGRIAATGTVDERRLERWLGHPYFSLPPPKSLDRDAFSFAVGELAMLSAADGAATLTAFTAAAVARGAASLPSAPRRWLVTGGGRHNPLLMAMLTSRLAAPVETVEAVGWRGDALEAEAFAFLAVRSLRGLPLTLPSTTGVARPQCGGQRHQPRRQG
jgi:anhydro-N-acetylmuramic acid kinase